MTELTAWATNSMIEEMKSLKTTDRFPMTQECVSTPNHVHVHVYLSLYFTHKSISVTYSAFQCSFYDMTLSCPTDQSIQVVRANYGHYEYTSTQDDLICKPPEPVADCMESMESNFPADWLILTELCNGRNNCTFPAQIVGMTSCGEEVATADYTQVWFECMPGIY